MVESIRLTNVNYLLGELIQISGQKYTNADQDETSDQFVRRIQKDMSELGITDYITRKKEGFSRSGKKLFCRERK